MRWATILAEIKRGGQHGGHQTRSQNTRACVLTPAWTGCAVSEKPGPLCEPQRLYLWKEGTDPGLCTRTQHSLTEWHLNQRTLSRRGGRRSSGEASDNRSQLVQASEPDGYGFGSLDLLIGNYLTH